MNSYSCLGRLTKDCDVRYFENGNVRTNFSIAVNGKKEEALFFDCEAWGKQASAIAEGFKKGQRIGISGPFRMNTWEGSDGQKHSRLVLCVDRFTFIEKKED